MTSARSVLEQAYLSSSKNNPAEIEASPEPLARVARAQAKMFAVAAAANPALIGERLAVPQTAGTWARPTLAASVYYLTDAGGREVAVVPFYDLGAEPARPAVYELGGFFHPAGRENDPVGSLTVWCARHPTPPASLDDGLDPAYPDAFAPLLAAEVAVELALKDGRAEELPALVAARDDWLRLYLAHLKGATTTSAARYQRRFAGVDLSSLLAGGSGVSL